MMLLATYISSYKAILMVNRIYALCMAIGQLAIYGETARQKQAHINLPYLEEMF